MVQVLQLALPTRDPALQDAIWNMLGWVIGGAMARLITRFGIVDWRPDQERQHWLVPVCLMLCWVAYDFFPYIPTIDFQGYKDALKPLLLNPLFKLDSFLMRLVAWLLFALSMDYVWGAEKTRRVFPLVSLGSLPLKVAIVNNGLNVHVVAAVVLANVLWAIVGSRHTPPYSLVAKLIVVAIVAMGILPLDYDFDYARTFHLIPFAGAMNGSMVVNFLSIVLKSYLFGGFFWVLIQLRASLAPAIILLSIVVLGVEIVQVFSVEHTAEITDVFILIIIGFMVHSVAPREQFGYSRISND
jgi:hypothetical protein